MYAPLTLLAFSAEPLSAGYLSVERGTARPIRPILVAVDTRYRRPFLGRHHSRSAGCEAFLPTQDRPNRSCIAPWANRLFALTIGSWLYRIMYGTWFLWSRSFDEMEDWSDWLGALMVFFFYVPNLIFAEFFICAGRQNHTARADLSASGSLLTASGPHLLRYLTFAADISVPTPVGAWTGNRREDQACFLSDRVYPITVTRS